MPGLQTVRSAPACLRLATACRQELGQRCCVHLLPRFLPAELFLPPKGRASSDGPSRLELAQYLRLRTAARFASWPDHPLRQVQRSARRHGSLFSRQGAPADGASYLPPLSVVVLFLAEPFLLLPCAGRSRCSPHAPLCAAHAVDAIPRDRVCRIGL